MHAEDERDPLDRWLSEQARPLPPPPGTFELITRRARRRKLRKLAVTMVSAAAVAAAVAVAVPVGLNLHLSPPSAKDVERGRRRRPDAPDRVARREREHRQDGQPVSLVGPPGDHPGRLGPPGPGQLPARLDHVRERAGRLGDRPGRHPRAVRQQGPVHLHVDRADRRRRADLAGRPGPGHRRPERRDRGQRHQVPQQQLRLGLRPRAVGDRQRRHDLVEGRHVGSAGHRPGDVEAAAPTRCGPPAARPRAAGPRPASRPAAPATR